MAHNGGCDNDNNDDNNYNDYNSALRVIYYHLRDALGIDKHPIITYDRDDVEEVAKNSICHIY